MPQKDLCAVRIFHFTKYNQPAFTYWLTSQHLKILKVFINVFHQASASSYQPESSKSSLVAEDKL